MAQKNRNENYDALGSIFDFIFKESEKPANKRRPIKSQDLSGETNLSDALAATLEMPGAFLTNTSIAELNTALDFQIADINFGERGKITISANNIADVIRDPGAFVDKAIKKGQTIRKSQRARFIGEFIDDYLTTAWAQKYGNLEAKKIALASGSARDRFQKHKIARAVGQSSRGFDPRGRGTPGATSLQERDFMLNRSVDLIGERTFGERWYKMPEAERNDFMDILTGTDKISDIKERDVEKFDRQSIDTVDVQRYLTRKYGKNEAMGFARAVNWKGVIGAKNSSGVVEPGVIDILDPELYRFLENDHLTGRINNLKNARPGSEEEKERKIYEKMKLRINLRTKLEIDELKEILKNPNLTDAQRDKIQGAIDDGNKARDLMGGRGGVVASIGRIEGYLNSLQNVYGGVLGSNLIPSIINGDFFDSGKNTIFNPVEKKKVATELIPGGVEIFRAKDGKSKFKNAYFDMGESLYYLTPRSLIRTLTFNGEGFARILDRNIKALEGIGIDKESIVKGALGKISDEDIKKLIDEKFANLSDIEKDKIKKKIQNLMKSNSTYTKLTKIFSTNARIQGKIKGLVSLRMKKIRARFARSLLKNTTLRKWLVKSGATKLLGQWIAKGGIQTLVKSLVTAVAGAAGVALTPLGSILIMLVTGFVTDILMKFAKYALEVAKLVVIGIAAFIFLILAMGFGNWKKLNRIIFADHNVVPGEVISCAEDYGFGSIAPNPYVNPIIPPDTEQECVLGTQGIYCSQGYEDVSGWSHQNMASLLPVDLTNVDYIYAPQFCATGDCSITAIRDINCGDGTNAGGVVIFEANDGTTTYTFKLLHVQPLAGLGEKLSGGQPVAVVQSGLEVGWCWTGKHLHLETQQNGQVVDPLELLQSFNCNVPDETGCDDP